MTVSSDPASTPSPQLVLHPLGGAKRTLEQQLTMFHLAVVALDPYTNESSWILPTAGRILSAFEGADCRVGWLIAADEYDARAFLGPWTDRFLTFVDPGRETISGLGLTRLPAWVHIGTNGKTVSVCEGWNPDEWRSATHALADVMSWSRPAVPQQGDPVAFDGSPAAG